VDKQKAPHPTAWGSFIELVAAHEGKHKDLVKFISHQTCITPHTIRQLVRSLELKTKVSVNGRLTEEPPPTILVEALAAPDPEALAIQALEEDWTAKQTRQEARRLKNEEIQKTRISA